jgi:signal transduction histidine kinase
MRADATDQNDYQVLILPITRRDGEATGSVLKRAGLSCAVCNDASDLADRVRRGAGAVIVSDAMASRPGLDRLSEALAGQAPWSDLPIILLSRADAPSAARLIATLRNVTVLDRPASTRALLSSAQAAIRSRRRQYEIRDQLRALQDADDALRHASRLKDEFLAMLAHELRNPLAPIRTASELLARQLTPESRSLPAVEIIKRQVGQLTRLVDDLLDVSRITQGRIQLQLQPLELSSIVSQALESIEPMLRAKGHRLSVETPVEKLYVSGDRARLVQCMTNLLNNAAKYTDSGGEIRVTTHSEASAAVVSVADNGVGISPELLPRVFEPFVQGARSLDRSEGGLGIGLSVVQRLIEMHGGEVSAQSRGPHQGSTFELRLPQIPAAASAEPERAPLGLRSQKVLVVDDNVDAASCLADVLRTDGHMVEAVFTAKGALQKAAALGFDVILLDIGLPDMDGYQVARKIRETDRSTRLIALTGYGQPEDRQRTVAAGFDAHLVKPVDLATLDSVIARATTLRP